MGGSFKALRVHQDGERCVARLDTLTLDDLTPGEVVIRGAWSSINYKDALAVSGKGRILRRYPLVAGVDIAGTVVSSADPALAPGTAVVVTGSGLSETADGGFTQFARVRAEAVCPLPAELDPRAAMAIGTAGFTAALALHRMEQNGQHPGLGPIAITGATGGVGSLAIDILAGRGYAVTALTHKAGSGDYLRALGAQAVQVLGSEPLGTRPLERPLWGGAIDNLGGEVLGWLTRTTQPNGNVASIGLAAGASFPATVMPFILRGVSLLGINSVDVPHELRCALWRRLATDLKPAHLERIVRGEVTLDGLPGCVDGYLEGSITGRTLVRLAD
jgi:NADPH2:quinone reductase